jgi:hypothetical protein
LGDKMGSNLILKMWGWGETETGLGANLKTKPVLSSKLSVWENESPKPQTRWFPL